MTGAPEATRAARAGQLEGELAAERARRRRRLIAAALGCLGSAAAGIALIGVALHLTDPGWAAVAFWGGVAVGNGGILATAIALYLGAQERGDV